MPTVTTTFVRSLRKVYLNKKDSDTAEKLMHIVRLLQGKQYQMAIDYGKEHGFDLEEMKRAAGSGPLGSNWTRVIEALEVWGTKPRFLSPDKPIDIIPPSGSRTNVVKTDADRPNYY